MKIENLPRNLWDPCCGDGAMVLPLREAGFGVYATDLVDRGCPASRARIDFLMEYEYRPVNDKTGIVMNPPYKLAQAFCEKALTFVPYVAALLPLSFLAGQERHRWFKDCRLQRVHVSSRRLPMMHRDGWEGPKATSQVDHAWFVWDARFAPLIAPCIRWFDYDHL
jgi:hypothetical protein